MSAPYDYVLVAREGDVATVTVNRPDKRNALSAKVIAELTHAFHHLRFAKGEDAVRAVILTGAGDRAFVAGADIAAMSAMTSPEAYAFSGFALGGGCELMLACDLAYASESAQLGQPEVSLGVIPGFGGTQRLTRRVGIAKARELVFTGDLVSAAEAKRIGLVNDVFSAADLLPKVRAIAAKIATKGPLAVASAKRVMLRGADLELASAHELEAQAFGVLFGSEDQREGMAAFLEKRAAKFSGK